jgi:hypothetical protein
MTEPDTPNDPPILVTLYAGQTQNGEWYGSWYCDELDTLKITVCIENGVVTAEVEVLQ